MADMDTLQKLEERIRQVVGTVEKLRAENSELKSRIAELEARPPAADPGAAAAAAKLEELERERTAVRKRLEKLLELLRTFADRA